MVTPKLQDYIHTKCTTATISASILNSSLTCIHFKYYTRQIKFHRNAKTYLSQISFGETPSSMALVSVAVPYSSVPHMYKALYPRLRQYRANTSALRTPSKTTQNQFLTAERAPTQTECQTCNRSRRLSKAVSTHRNRIHSLHLHITRQNQFPKQVKEFQH